MENPSSEGRAEVLPDLAESAAIHPERRGAEFYKLVSFLSAILSVALLCFNVALITQNRRLKASAGETPQAFLSRIGTKVPRLEGVATDGSRLSLTFPADGKKTVLFVFATTCRVCDLNWPAWHLIERSVNDRSYRLVYANVRSSLSSGYLTKHGVFGGTVFAEVDPRSVATLNLGLTPLTVLLGLDGSVEHVWPGMLEAADLTDIRTTLAQ